ncbi:MAG: hypothetical protein ACHQVK_04015, partial [Candidatus Paceibacterales bacterium]
MAGAYANIQSALDTGAQIAAKTQGPMGAAAAVVQPLGEEAQKRRDELYKYTLQDHLNQNEVGYKAQAEGKSLTTQDELDTHAAELGISPDRVKGLIGKAGVWQ